MLWTSAKSGGPWFLSAGRAVAVMPAARQSSPQRFRYPGVLGGVRQTFRAARASNLPVGPVTHVGFIAGMRVCGAINRERQAMINSKNVVAALRRDVAFVWHAVIAVVFIGFASLAVAAALLDVLAIRH